MKKNKISFICVAVIALTLVSACGTGANESAKTDAIEVVEITEVPVEQESELFVPTKEDVYEIRENVVAGMSTEEISRITENIKVANLTLEHAYLYENLFERLSNPDDMYWNYIDYKGEIQIGWAVEGSENMQLSQEEHNEKSVPVMTENRFDADAFIDLMDEMKASIKTELLQEDFENLIQYMSLAKETHNVEYIKNIYYILHDMDYFLFRYGIEDVGPYVNDDSTLNKFYDVLSVYNNSIKESEVGKGAGDSSLEYPIEEQELSPFELILNSIYDSLKSDFTSEEICCDFLSTGIREVIAGQTADERMKAVAYCVKDINLDGVDELLILDPLYPEPGNVRILDMYTLIDRTAVKVIEGWARNRYYLLEDGMIYCSGSSGAAYSNEELLLFKDGSDKLTPTELYFTYPKGEDMDNGGFYYSPDGVYDVEAATEISADDFRAFCNECNQKIVEFEAKTFDSLKQRID